MGEPTAERPLRRFVDPSVLRQLGSTGLRARAVVEGVMAGVHRNPNRGASVEFAEYKEYAPGDDPRRIDWRALGRVDRYYVKQFEDETNLRAHLLLDTSGSMGFAFERAPTKLVYASTLLATLAHVLLYQGDAVGLLTYAERPEVWLPPSSRRSQLDDICGVLDGVSPTGGTSLEDAIHRVGELARKRALVVIASDLLDPARGALEVARVLRKRGVEVVVFQILDRAELELPFEGLALFEGMEGDGQLMVDPDDVRGAYRRHIGEHLAALRAGFAAGDVEYFRAVTDTPIERVLLEFLESRRRR